MRSSLFVALDLFQGIPRERLITFFNHSFFLNRLLQFTILKAKYPFSIKVVQRAKDRNSLFVRYLWKLCFEMWCSTCNAGFELVGKLVTTVLIYRDNPDWWVSFDWSKRDNKFGWVGALHHLRASFQTIPGRPSPHKKKKKKFTTSLIVNKNSYKKERRIRKETINCYKMTI